MGTTQNRRQNLAMAREELKREMEWLEREELKQAMEWMARNGLGEEMGNISHIDEWTAGQLDKAEAYRLRIARKSAELAKAAELHAPFVKS